MFWSKEDVHSDQIISLEFSAQMNLKQSQKKPEELFSDTEKFHTWTYDIRVYISSLKRHIFPTKLVKYD